MKYGTNDPYMVSMLKNGFSLSISHLLLTNYNKYLNINIDTEEVSCSPELIEEMKRNGENPIQILEVKNYI